jgi:hypothetical protein
MITYTKKCSRCRKVYNIKNFGCKKNGETYKTCMNCRKKVIIENDESENIENNRK